MAMTNEITYVVTNEHGYPQTVGDNWYDIGKYLQQRVGEHRKGWTLHTFRGHRWMGAREMEVWPTGKMIQSKIDKPIYRLMEDDVMAVLDTLDPEQKVDHLDLLQWMRDEFEIQDWQEAIAVFIEDYLEKEDYIYGLGQEMDDALGGGET